MELAATSVGRSLSAIRPSQGIHVPTLVACGVADEGVGSSYRSGALDRAGDLAVLAEVEQGVLAKAIQPYAAAGVPVAYAHRDQPTWVPPRWPVCSDAVTTSPTTLTAIGQSGYCLPFSQVKTISRATADRAGARRHQAQVRGASRERASRYGERQRSRGQNRFEKCDAHSCPQVKTEVNRAKISPSVKHILETSPTSRPSWLIDQRVGGNRS